MLKARSGFVLLIIIAAFCLFQQGCSKSGSGIQQVQELGFDFRQGAITKTDNKGQSQQYQFFFYKQRPLCQIGPAAPSVAPSGNFGVCYDVRSAKIMLFRRSDEKLVSLTPMPLPPPTRFVWHESDGNVEAIIGKEGFSSVYPLQ